MFATTEFASEADAQYVIDLYDAEIRYLDNQLARLFNFIKSGPLNETRSSC